MAQVDVTRIASNIGALNALNSLQTINAKLALHQTRLSTGKRINSAADDPAGLTIATKMLARSEGMKVANDNIGDAMNMLSVAESGLSKMNDILVIMRNKAEQAASDTLGASERDAIATQLSAFAEQIDSMVAETKWNGTQLLDGTVDKRFQTGVDDGEYTNFTLSSKFDPGTLGISTQQVGNSATLSTTGTLNLSSISGTPDPFTGLTRLTTGTYTINTLAVATSDTVGAVDVTSNEPGWGVSAVAPTGTELANGVSYIRYKSYDAATDVVTFTVTTDGVSSDKTSDLTGIFAAGVANLGNGLAIDMGNFADETAFESYVSGLTASATDIAVDYVKKDTVKYEIRNGSNEAVAIDADGLSGNESATVGYALHTIATDTGRGLQVTFKDTGSVSAGSQTFTYARENNYSVDVSSAQVASSYMGKVNTAMNTVNESLAKLGSLMARLTYKAEQVANAQVNIEGAYNRIMNANMAEEQMNASKYTILQQTAVAMLAQANQAPQSLLALFR